MDIDPSRTAGADAEPGGTTASSAFTQAAARNTALIVVIAIVIVMGTRLRLLRRAVTEVSQVFAEPATEWVEVCEQRP